MGTKGFITFAADGDEKTIQIRHDAYPSRLGIDCVNWARAAVRTPGPLSRAIAALRPLTEDAPPTDLARLDELGDVTDLNPGHVLDTGVYVDDTDFPLDSLFAEWGYVIDLDASTFEVYRGFQQTRHSRGRFASRSGEKHAGLTFGGGYFPVALVKSWPLDSLPTAEAFLATFGGAR